MKQLLTVLLVTSLLISCSHAHTISIPVPVPKGQRHAPVDLSSFWKENEFALVDTASEYKKSLYESSGGYHVIAVREKWFKGFLFKYSGGIRATEIIEGERYKIVFFPTAGRSESATKVAKSLKKYLDKNYPDLKVEITSESFVDLR